jgi:hypothetical protein
MRMWEARSVRRSCSVTRRARNPKTNGHIQTGFWHSVGAIMATRAYREGKKIYWDRIKEEIVDHPLRTY